MKTAFEWVDDGIPMLSGKASDRERYVRWVGMIQEDAVKCYETTATIEEVEMAFGQFMAELDLLGVQDMDGADPLKGALGVLKLKMEELAKLKVPVEE